MWHLRSRADDQLLPLGHNNHEQLGYLMLVHRFFAGRKWATVKALGENRRLPRGKQLYYVHVPYPCLFFLGVCCCWRCFFLLVGVFVLKEMVFSLWSFFYPMPCHFCLILFLDVLSMCRWVHACNCWFLIRHPKQLGQKHATHQWESTDQISRCFVFHSHYKMESYFPWNPCSKVFLKWEIKK